MTNSFAQQFGNIDIYLFDQLMRRRTAAGMTVLDCGCGGGRNLAYLLRNGFDVYAVDASKDAIDAVQKMASVLAPQLPPERFRVEAVEDMTMADASADVVLSNAVLHFARDEAQFRGTVARVAARWLLFCRLASTIGMEGEFERVEGGVFSPCRRARSGF